MITTGENRLSLNISTSAYLVTVVLGFSVFVAFLISYEYLSPVAVLLLPLLLLSVVLIARHPLFGLGLLILVVPLDQRFSTNSFILSLSPSNLLLPLTYALLFARWSIARVERPRIPVFLAFTLGLYAVSGLFERSSSQVFGRQLITTIGATGTVLLATLLIKNVKDLRIVAVFYAISGLLQVILGIVQQWTFFAFGLTLGIERAFFFSGSVTPRSTGTHLDPNYYAIFLIPAFALGCTVYSFGTTKRKRTLGAILAIFVVVGVLISWSRTGLIACGFVGILVILLRVLSSPKPRAFRLSPRFLIVSASIIAGLSFLILPGLNLPGITQLVDLNEKSVTHRFDINSEAVAVSLESPLFGVGNSRATSDFVHNTYLYLFLRAGLFGFVPFFAIILRTLLTGASSIILSDAKNNTGQTELIAFTLGFAAMMISAFVFGIEGHKMLWLLLGIEIAAVSVVQHHRVDAMEITPE